MQKMRGSKIRNMKYNPKSKCIISYLLMDSGHCTTMLPPHTVPRNTVLKYGWGGVGVNSGDEYILYEKSHGVCRKPPT
jgi:hypothetical protein